MTPNVLDIAVLVFREGLESILVLAAITANMAGERSRFQRPVALGAVAGFLATLVTWLLVISLVDTFADSVPALDIQAATGLIAIIVLLVVMNWFFHKVYWTGWISMHSRKKQELLKTATESPGSKARLALGFGLLGFTSLYREGVEVVLFLQTYRLKLGGVPVFYGVAAGLILTSIVGLLTFVAHRHLPYRRMLVLTGMMLGLVLLVMVGEQAQEMQQAGWLGTTPIKWLELVIPWWAGLWLSIFPSVETLSAQALAAALVVGSYVLAGRQARNHVSPVV